ncbi:hypothetical protein Tco_1172071 [Tanacetum coccineum]
MDEVDGKVFVENGLKLNKIDESQVGVPCLEDSKMDCDKVCKEARKSSELESNVSCKVDVDGMMSNTNVQDDKEDDGDILNKEIDHSKEVKENSIDLEFSDDGKGNEGQSSGDEINNCGKRILHKRTKNKAKNDKTEHGMDKYEKTKPNRRQKVKQSKSSRLREAESE